VNQNGEAVGVGREEAREVWRNMAIIADELPPPQTDTATALKRLGEGAAAPHGAMSRACARLGEQELPARGGRFCFSVEDGTPQQRLAKYRERLSQSNMCVRAGPSASASTRATSTSATAAAAPVQATGLLAESRGLGEQGVCPLARGSGSGAHVRDSMREAQDEEATAPQRPCLSCHPAANPRASAPRGVLQTSESEAWPVYPWDLRQGFNDTWSAYQQSYKGHVTRADWLEARSLLRCMAGRLSYMWADDEAGSAQDDEAPKKRPLPDSCKNLVGARVHVQCDDGVFYEGIVERWNSATAEYHIALDDGISHLSAFLSYCDPTRARYLIFGLGHAYLAWQVT